MKADGGEDNTGDASRYGPAACAVYACGRRDPSTGLVSQPPKLLQTYNLGQQLVRNRRIQGAIAGSGGVSDTEEDRALAEASAFAGDGGMMADFEVALGSGKLREWLAGSAASFSDTEGDVFGGVEGEAEGRKETLGERRRAWRRVGRLLGGGGAARAAWWRTAK